MEAACQRLCEGDTSSLVDIVNCIEARKSHETHRLGTRTLTAIINILIQEGVELRRIGGQEYSLPSPTAFFALRILAQLGIRQTEDGAEVQRALLVLGLQRCRDLCLDAYFGLCRPQRYYVVMFVKLLTVLYGCTPQDLLRSETSINMLTGSLEVGNTSPSPPAAAGGGEAGGARGTPQQSGRSVSGNVNVSGGLTSGRGINSRSVPRSAQSPPPPREAATNSSRPSNIQNRSALLVSIPGASFDMPLRATRRYRDLPKKPINAPFAVNPLYEDPASQSNGGAGHGDATLLSRPDTPVPLSPEPAPLTRAATPEVIIPAQFPTPVVLFASYYGLSCVPRLPTADDLARLDVWRMEKQQHPPPPRDVQKSIIKTCKGSAEGGDAGREFGKMRLVALRSNPSSPAPATAPQDFEVHNKHTFAPNNVATLPYQQACLESPLLRDYLDSGKLLSWGSAAKGALGPQRQRRCHNAFTQSSRAPASLLPSYAASSKATAPRSSSAASAQRRGSSGGATLPATTSKAVTPLTSTLDATRGTQAVPDTTRGAAAGQTKNSVPNQADYVYLPTSVYTSSRVVGIACGLSVTYLVTIDGALYSCGRGENGQLGIGERALRYSETGTSRLQRVLLKDAERITRVAAGTACAVALAVDRALYCWGHNVYGQCLKLPDLSRVLTPVRLKTTTYKVLDICFGQFFGVLLFDDGIMGTWGIASMLGCNVGDKGLEDSLAPDQCKCARQVVHLELASGCPMAAVRAGPWHALAISKQGEVYTWGVGRDGRLGHGGDNAEVKPRLVEGLRSCFVVDASCASAHTAVLTSNGSVYVFGENAEGQLGLRGKSPRRLPTALPLPGKALAVACAREHTCVLLEDGDVVACGSYRTSGVGLGYGTRLCAPVRILTNYVSLVLQCGHFHSFAGVLPRRTALMMVGRSSIDEVARILSVVVRTGVRCAASGVGFLVVLSENNSLVSIGRGERGQLGIGDCMKPASSDDVTVTPKFTPVQLPPDVVVQHLRCGPDFVVALDQDGAVYGWGSNECQKLSQPRTIDYLYAPVRLTGYGQHRVVQVACGGTFVIALASDGTVLAHGEAAYCGLGEKSGNNNSGSRNGIAQSTKKQTIGTPTPITALHDIVAVAAGRRHAIAMTSSCNIFAWGVGVLGCASGAGQGGGDAFTPVAYTPVRVALSQTIRTIGCGIHNSFAITEDGELWVWGVNYYGECGVPPNRDGGVAPSAASHAQQHGGAAPPGIDAARVIQTPISVARQVRDAAFTSQFGLVIFEDGQVRVSGRVRHGGQRYLLPSFHSTPQPLFSVDVNEPVRRRWPEGDVSLSSGLSRAEGAAASTPAAAPAATAAEAADAATGVKADAQPARRGTQEVISLGEGEDEDEDDDDDATSTQSSLGSGVIPRLSHPSASAQLPSATVAADSSAEGGVLGKRAVSATAADARPVPLQPPPPSALSSRGSLDPPHRLSCGSDDRARASRASGSGVLTADLPTPTARASPRLPPVRPSSGPHRTSDASAAGSAAGVGRKLVSPPPPQVREPPAPQTGRDGGNSVSRLSPLPGPDLLPTTTYSAAQEMMTAVATAAAAEAAAEAANANLFSYSNSDPHNLADYFDSPSATRSPDVSVNRTRNFPEADDGSPLPPPSLTQSGRSALKEKAESKSLAVPGEPLGQLSPSLSSMPRPPQSPPPSGGALRPSPASTQPAAKTKKKSRSRSSSPVPGAGDASASATAEKATRSKRVRRTPTPPPNAQTSPSAASPLSAATPKGNHVFGVRCFSGWEQICTVMEKHRPSATEVRMAHDGLQVIQH